MPYAPSAFLAGVPILRDGLSNFDVKNWRRQLYHIMLRDIQVSHHPLGVGL